MWRQYHLPSASRTSSATRASPTRQSPPDCCSTARAQHVETISATSRRENDSWSGAFDSSNIEELSLDLDSAGYSADGRSRGRATWTKTYVLTTTYLSDDDVLTWTTYLPVDDLPDVPSSTRRRQPTCVPMDGCFHDRPTGFGCGDFRRSWSPHPRPRMTQRRDVPGRTQADLCANGWAFPWTAHGLRVLWLQAFLTTSPPAVRSPGQPTRLNRPPSPSAYRPDRPWEREGFRDSATAEVQRRRPNSLRGHAASLWRVGIIRPPSCIRDDDHDTGTTGKGSRTLDIYMIWVGQ